MKRWPFIRHVRYAFHLWQFNRWWDHVGRSYWLAPNTFDEQYLEDIWQGKA